MSRGSIELGGLQPSYEIKLLMLAAPSKAATDYAVKFHKGARSVNGSFFQTIGVDFYKRTMTVEGEKHDVGLWRLSAMSKFGAVTARFINGYGALVALYDPADKASFLAIQEQLRAVQIGAGKDSPSVVVVAYSYKEGDAQVTAADKEAFEKEFSPKAHIDVVGATPAEKEASLAQSWRDIATVAKQFLSKRREGCVDLRKPDLEVRSSPCCS